MVVEAFWFWKVVDERALLKLVSRMIIRCDSAEDEELIALASYVYRTGIYDEVILQYLMKFRFGPVDELLDIWKVPVVLRWIPTSWRRESFLF